MVTGGMSIKSGFVLARAQLAANSSTGVVAAQERQTAMVGKGKYREEEKVAQELPVGSLATNEMPRRKDWQGSPAQFTQNMQKWLRTKVSVKVRRGRRVCAMRIARMRAVLGARAQCTADRLAVARARAAGEAGAHGGGLREDGAAHERVDAGAKKCK